ELVFRFLVVRSSSEVAQVLQPFPAERYESSIAHVGPVLARDVRVAAPRPYPPIQSRLPTIAADEGTGQVVQRHAELAGYRDKAPRADVAAFERRRYLQQADQVVALVARSMKIVELV